MAVSILIASRLKDCSARFGKHKMYLLEIKLLLNTEDTNHLWISSQAYKDIVVAPGPYVRVIILEFKTSSAVSLLDAFITISPMCFWRASKVLLFSFPQHGQTQASYYNSGLLITEFKYKLHLHYVKWYTHINLPKALETTAFRSLFQLKCLSKITPKHLSSITCFMADRLIVTKNWFTFSKFPRSAKQHCLSFS